MTNFISVKYCKLYMLSLYTIGSYNLSYPSNINQLSTRNPEQIKTTDNNIQYFKNFEERLIRSEETLKNIIEFLQLKANKIMVNIF